MRDPQPAMSVMTDNSMACGIINYILKQCQTHILDMCFYWVCDRCIQGHFLVYWALGTENKGDYHTKHHHVLHQHRVCPEFCLNQGKSRPDGLIGLNHISDIIQGFKFNAKKPNSPMQTKPAYISTNKWHRGMKY
eukprot:4995461-Ditylum_brightwellii.AAC.1